MTRAPDTASWRLATWALVKSTGFAYEHVESLRSPALAAAVESGDTEAITSAVTRCLDQLITICSDDRFLEAVLVSSPAAYERLASWLGSAPDTGALRSEDRRKALLAAKYLQRFCAKNESTSFFGPVFWAPLKGPSVDLDIGDPGTPRLKTLWTHWAAQALADAMNSDPDVLSVLPPNAPANLILRDGRYRTVDYLKWPTEITEIAPPDTVAERRLLARCDGRTTPARMAVAENEGVTVTVERLRRLADRGLIDFGLRVPVGLIDPMAFLHAVAADLPAPARERWEKVLADLAHRTREVNVASGPKARRASIREVFGAFTDLTGRPAEKDAGKHYADRSVLVEDGVFSWTGFAIGDPLSAYLRDEFPPVMDLLFELPLARRRRRVEVITEWFHNAFTGRVVPLDEVIEKANADGLAALLRREDTAAAEDGPSALTDVLLSNAGRSRVHKEQDWAVQNAAAVDFDTWCVAGADLFVAAPHLAAVNDDRFTVVVGEVHGLHDQLLQGLWPALHPDRRDLEGDVGRLIGELTDGQICEPVLTHWRKTLARAQVLPEIEFHGPSAQQRHLVGRAADLVVAMEDGRLTLRCEALGRVYLTRPPLLSWDDEIESVFTPFTGARIVSADDMFRSLDHTDHLPRLTVGRTVVHRETWRLPPSSWGRWHGLGPDNQIRIRRLKEKYGLPEQIYAKFPGEPKPIFVDFDVPVLVDIFARSYARAVHPVTVSEMLPGPCDLWLADHDGRHTSELRFGYYRGQPGRATPSDHGRFQARR